RVATAHRRAPAAHGHGGIGAGVGPGRRRPSRAWPQRLVVHGAGAAVVGSDRGRVRSPRHPQVRPPIGPLRPFPPTCRFSTTEVDLRPLGRRLRAYDTVQVSMFLEPPLPDQGATTVTTATTAPTTTWCSGSYRLLHNVSISSAVATA